MVSELRAIILPMSSPTCLDRPYGSKGIMGCSSSSGRYRGTKASPSWAHPMPKALDENTTRRRPSSAADIMTLKVLATLLSKMTLGGSRSGPGMAPM